MPGYINLLREFPEHLAPPASGAALAQLRRVIEGAVIDDVVAIYRDHDGSALCAGDGNVDLPVRLMPVEEVVALDEELAWLREQNPTLGRPLWLWTDDNSNYVGLYVDGLFSGWLTVLDHDEPLLTPAYRSVLSFVVAMTASARNNVACDARTIPRDVPMNSDDTTTIARDRSLAQECRRRYEVEGDEDMQRLLAASCMALTPPSDTHMLVPFLSDPDMWTPEIAARLIAQRRYAPAIPALGRLAESGMPNGNGAAMDALLHLNTPDALAEVDRLRSILTGQNLQMLEQAIRLRSRA